jgi:inorganic pyrophosphatase
MKAFIEIATHTTEGPMFDSNTLEIIGSKTFHVASPYAYGFIIGTHAPDDAALDCYLVSDSNIFAGTTLEVEPIGGVEFWDNGVEDHKILVREVGSSIEMTEGVKHTLVVFSDVYFANLPERDAKVGKFFDADAAIELVQKYTV